MPQARVRHILMESEEGIRAIMDRLRGGENFSELAAENSMCPSSRKGGNLGTFGPGKMVPEFDHVCFSAEVGVPVGPVKTQFGYHLIEVLDRKG